MRDRRIGCKRNDIFGAKQAALRNRHSPLSERDFFHPLLILSLVFQTGLDTICGVPVGAALNLLWLGLKMIIFGRHRRAPLWISGTAR